jgi:hypothetical protein
MIRARLIPFPGTVGSCDDAVLSKVQIVHRLINYLFYFLPVAAPLYELVNVLPSEVGLGP